LKLILFFQEMASLFDYLVIRWSQESLLYVKAPMQFLNTALKQKLFLQEYY